MIAVARLAILVGIAGLIPFIGLLAGLFFMPQYSVALLGYFYLYSAGILAFMAGVYWPIAMQLDNCCYPLSPLMTMLLSQVFFCGCGGRATASCQWPDCFVYECLSRPLSGGRPLDEGLLASLVSSSETGPHLGGTGLSAYSGSLVSPAAHCSLNSEGECRSLTDVRLQTHLRGIRNDSAASSGQFSRSGAPALC